MKSHNLDTLYKGHLNCELRLNRKEVIDWFESILGIIIPEYKEKAVLNREDLIARMAHAKARFCRFLELNGTHEVENICMMFHEHLMDIKNMLDLDAEAIYEGDPAAKSLQEVRYAYLTFYAIAAYRIAHELYKLNVTIIPRIIAEHAHSKTGIDIHPGAQIGQRLCIDHGTGVVIGETTVIGDNVKIYQGVTLGALSVSKQDANIKRHPTVGNNVVIYSGATILGGKTHIGDNAVIGGNVWLVNSVPANTKLYFQSSKVNGEQIPVK